MTSTQSKQLRNFIRDARDSMKNSIDDLARIAESAIEAFDSEPSIPNATIQPIIDRGLINKTQLSERLGISTRTISDLMTDGLPFVKFGKRVQFDYADVLTWAKQRNARVSGKSRLRVVR